MTDCKKESDQAKNKPEALKRMLALLHVWTYTNESDEPDCVYQPPFPGQRHPPPPTVAASPQTNTEVYRPYAPD
jgi:hypothetical protein